RAIKESGSGPGEEGKSLTIPPGTALVTRLPSPATQNGEAHRRNTTRAPPALHVEKTVLNVAVASRARVPRARSSASMFSPLSMSSRRPSGEIRGVAYRPDGRYT